MVWIGLGIWATIAAKEEAASCGWWLWGLFIAQIIYVPFALIFHSSYVIGIIERFKSPPEDVTTGSGCMDGCIRGGLFVALNFVGGCLVGLSAHALWGVSCTLAGTLLRNLATAGFYITAILLGLSVSAGLAEAGYTLCQSHISS